MRFVIAVRQKKVAWPTQRRFRREEWQRVASELSEDEEDTHLDGAGTWVATALEEVRSRLESPVWACGADRVVPALVGVVTRDLVVQTEHIRRALSNRTGLLREDELRPRYSPDSGVPGVDTAALHEWSVDVL